LITSGIGGITTFGGATPTAGYSSIVIIFPYNLINHVLLEKNDA
jgi:hypothetical protein